MYGLVNNIWVFTDPQALVGQVAVSVCTMPHTEGIDNVVIFWDDDDGSTMLASYLLAGSKMTSFLGPCDEDNFIQGNQAKGEVL